MGSNNPSRDPIERGDDERAPSVQARRPPQGGVWIHRADAAQLLDDKRRRGLVDGELADQLASLIERGYAQLPAAVPAATIDRFAALFDRIWEAPPRGLQYIDGAGVVGAVSAAQRDQIVRVVNLQLHSVDGPELLYPAPLLRLLRAVYERPPVCFQTMTFRHGSQQPIHVDTAYLPLLRHPLDLMASWTALQDVEPGSGELVYYDGSHKIAEYLFGGRSKALADGPAQHAQFLEYLTEECERRGLERRTFTPRKGDVLVWTADLAHGGAPVTRPELLRRSIVGHFMPFGARPSFYDASAERVVAYGAGFRLQRESESGGRLARALRGGLARLRRRP